MKLWQILLIVVGIIILLVIIANISVVHVETLATDGAEVMKERGRRASSASDTDLQSITSDQQSITSNQHTSRVLSNRKPSYPSFVTKGPTIRKIHVSELKPKPRVDSPGLSLTEGFSTETSVQSTPTRKAAPINRLLEDIESELVNTDYTFNMANRPVTVCYPSSGQHINREYVRAVRKDLESWPAKLGAKQLRVLEVKPLVVQDTGDEFELTANARFNYQARTLHLCLRYYGYVERADDFLNGGSTRNSYHLQLIEFRPIAPSDYSSSIQAASSQPEPFMSMADQLAYVSKVNTMHQNE